MKKRHSEEQTIRILRDAESHEVPIGEVCQQHNISEQRFYRWRDKYGGMEVADARLLKELKRKNAKPAFSAKETLSPTPTFNASSNADGITALSHRRPCEDMRRTSLAPSLCTSASAVKMVPCPAEDRLDR